MIKQDPNKGEENLIYLELDYLLLMLFLALF